ncbi:amino acid adenylation domain-containing protein [Yeosuana marina]|uniref:non-ribosomal peptide synthetase n=1 Tax=Yeosuana marina TaxID=1565536 RepID=UPI0030C7B635
MKKLEDILHKTLKEKNVKILLDETGHRLKLIGDIHNLTTEDYSDLERFKGKIIEILKEKDETENPSHSLIEPITSTVNYELSSSQHRIWLLAQFKGGSSAYNIPFHTYYQGAFDLGCFKQALSSVINRHEVLRTVFEDSSGKVRQKILSLSETNFEIKYFDLRNETNNTEKALNDLKKDFYIPFDLAEGPLIRSSVIRLAEDNYLLYFNIHHIIGDAWSMEILSNEVLVFYQHYFKGTPINLPKLKFQYKDYAVWQQNLLLNPKRDQSLKSYWHKKLSGQLPVMDLPFIKPRPKLKTFNGAKFHMKFSKGITSKLKEFTKSHQGTLFVGLLTSVNTLFYRYTGKKDIIFGTPIAGRNHTILENQIGLYLNTLVLRNQITDKDSFKSLFIKVKKSTIEDFEHQQYPFDKLIENLSFTRDVGRNPLFDVLISLSSKQKQFKNFSSKKNIKPIAPKEYEPSKTDLNFRFLEEDGCISLSLNFNTDIYDESDIIRFLSHYKQLLIAALESPGTSISKLKYLSDEEEKQILLKFNNTKVNYDKDKSLIKLFEERVSKSPQKTAIKSGNTILSFDELDKVSNQFARYLCEFHDFIENDFAGIFLERSEWIIVAILGVLKSKGVYVPIDPACPKERVNYILEDSNCKLLIDESTIDHFRKLQIGFSTKSFHKHNHWNDLVYTIYTSGSTGTPKGVLVENRGVVNHISWFNREFEITSLDNTVLSTSYAYDISATSIWSCLLSGATLHIIPENLIKNPEEYLTYLEVNEISFLKLVPSFFSVIVNSKKFKNSDCLRHMRVIKLGGENIIVKDLGECFKKYANIKFANHYGPTEASIGTTIEHIGRSDFLTFSLQPVIGSPYDNTRIYILDDFQQLVPIGVVGELYIAGDGVARGYLNAEELTKTKFVSNLFGEKKLYKTGDLGYWNPKGKIVFKGRIDNQVKIRGHRIELSEIETVLNTAKGVEHAVVITNENDAHEVELVAYLISRSKLSFMEIKLHLKKYLPDYMIPTYLIQLESLPLTDNGKIDKKALPTPEKMEPNSNQMYTPPRNAVEKKLVNLWEQILNKKNIGIHDDFFELGGHSLKAMRLTNSIEEMFDIKIEIENIFLEPTIVYLAKEINRLIWLKDTESKSDEDMVIVEI